MDVSVTRYLMDMHADLMVFAPVEPNIKRSKLHKNLPTSINQGE